MWINHFRPLCFMVVFLSSVTACKTSQDGNLEAAPSARSSSVFLVTQEIHDLALAVNSPGPRSIEVDTANAGKWACVTAAVGRVCQNGSVRLNTTVINALETSLKSSAREVVVKGLGGSWSCVSGMVAGRKCTFSENSERVGDSGEIFLVTQEIHDLAAAVHAGAPRSIEVKTANAGTWSCVTAAIGRICQNGTVRLNSAVIDELEGSIKSSMREVIVKGNDGTWSCINGIVQGRKCSFIPNDVPPT